MKKNNKKQVRISAELHGKLKLAAFKNAMTINHLAEDVIEKALKLFIRK